MRIPVSATLTCWLLASGLVLATTASATLPLTRADVWAEAGETDELLLQEPWMAPAAAAADGPANAAEAEQREEQQQIVDSLRCRGCHSFGAKEMTQMDEFAQRKHKRAREKRKLCLECHFRADICCH